MHDPGSPLDTVIVGAGGLGFKLAQAIGSPVVALADNDPAKHRPHDVVPILSIVEAHQRHPDARFVVAIWGANTAHRIAATEAQLRALGVWRIEPFGVVLRDHGLSHYWITPPTAFQDEMRAMLDGAKVWHDAESTRLFDLNVIARLGANPSFLPEPVDGPAYWRPELVKFDSSDVILDGGAYDGDSLKAYIENPDWRALPGFHNWIAVEPDTANYTKLRDAMTDPSMAFSPIHGALGTVVGSTRLESTGTLASRTGDEGPVVPVFTIDSLAPREKITMIKLDIEGDEMAALHGAWRRIQQDRPAIAVAVYHKPCDLWQIPLAIKAHCPDYRFHLRAHGAEGWDLVCYAIPPEKCA